MAKYRILQAGKSTFYAQEKKSFFHHWKYLGIVSAKTYGSWIGPIFHDFTTYHDALSCIRRRMDYLREFKENNKIITIHNLTEQP